jgi:hypothetical protein
MSDRGNRRKLGSTASHAGHSVRDNGARLHQRDSSSRSESSSINRLTDLREATQSTIEEAFQSERPTLVNAPPGSGKTYSVPRVADELSEPVTYLTERRDLYHDMEEECDTVGLSSYTLPSAHEECPVFADNDKHQDWQDKVRRLHTNGVSAGKIHVEFNLPCEDGQDCEYIDRLDFEPGDFDVLIGNYVHGYAKKYTRDRTVVLDEFSGDGYVHEIENVDRKVSAFLKRATGLRYSDYSDLTKNGVEPQHPDELRWWRTHDGEVSDRTIIEDDQGEISRRSAKLTLALLFMRDLGNGWESTRWYSRRRTDPVTDEAAVYDPPWRSLLSRDVEAARRTDSDTTTVWLREKPDFSEAESVVALDGTPVRKMWKAATGIAWHESRVVPEHEMGHYLHEVIGTQVLQAGNGTKPYHSGKWTSGDLDGALMLGADVRFGEKPGVISTKKVLDKYDGIDELADGTLNFARVKSNNDFTDKEVGVVLGTPHPGDDVLKRWGALIGRPVQGVSKQGQPRSYGSVGTDILRHFRENKVLQAILRFGRTPKSNATVLVNHEAYPEWVGATKIPKENVRFMGLKKRQVVRALRESSNPLLPNEMAEEAGCEKRHVTQNVLPDLEAEGLAEQVEHGWEWEWIDPVRDNSLQGVKHPIQDTVCNSSPHVSDYHGNPTKSVIDRDRKYREQLEGHTHSLEELREIANDKTHEFHVSARQMLEDIGAS